MNLKDAKRRGADVVRSFEVETGHKIEMKSWEIREYTEAYKVIEHG